MDESKRCTRCEELLPVSEFRFRADKQTLQWNCLVCERASARARYHRRRACVVTPEERMQLEIGAAVNGWHGPTLPNMGFGLPNVGIRVERSALRWAA